MTNSGRQTMTKVCGGAGTSFHDGSALERLRSYIASFDVGIDARLPPERHLCNILGLTRSQLRTALTKLEAEGLIWRHVGKGTFIGSKPIADILDLSCIVRLTNQREVAQMRQIIEPEIAALAAANATGADLAELHKCLERASAAQCKREYDAWDSCLHRTIAVSTHNSLLLSLMDIMASVRRAMRWERTQADGAPPAPSHHSFEDHAAIVAAIEDRQVEGSRAAMQQHLATIETNMLRRLSAA